MPHGTALVWAGSACRHPGASVINGHRSGQASPPLLRHRPAPPERDTGSAVRVTFTAARVKQYRATHPESDESMAAPDPLGRVRTRTKPTTPSLPLVRSGRLPARRHPGCRRRPAPPNGPALKPPERVNTQGGVSSADPGALVRGVMPLPLSVQVLSASWSGVSWPLVDGRL